MLAQTLRKRHPAASPTPTSRSTRCWLARCPVCQPARRQDYWRYLPAGRTIGAEFSYSDLKDKVHRLATALHEPGRAQGRPGGRGTTDSPHSLIVFDHI